MPVVQRVLFPQNDFDEAISEAGIKSTNKKVADKDENHREASHHEEMLHPNQEAEEDDEDDDENVQEKGCLHYFSVLDSQVLKPLFIYKYDY
jgi:hypothetical protein